MWLINLIPQAKLRDHTYNKLYMNTKLSDHDNPKNPSGLIFFSGFFVGKPIFLAIADRKNGILLYLGLS